MAKTATTPSVMAIRRHEDRVCIRIDIKLPQFECGSAMSIRIHRTRVARTQTHSPTAKTRLFGICLQKNVQFHLCKKYARRGRFSGCSIENGPNRKLLPRFIRCAQSSFGYKLFFRTSKANGKATSTTAKLQIQNVNRRHLVVLDLKRDQRIGEDRFVNFQGVAVIMVNPFFE